MRFLIAIAALLLLPTVVSAQVPPPKPEDSSPEDLTPLRTAESFALSKREVGRYVFYSGVNRDKPLKLNPVPVLQFTNPVVGEFYSNVFVWTQNGRPEVVASITNWYRPHQRFGGEFQSLSLNSLTAVRDGRTVWTPENQGVDFKPVPGASDPRDGPSARLLEMRAMARDFTVEAKTTADRSAVPRQLRLMTRPLIRYESTEQKVSDGAIFAFVRGTDPELLLLIEARQTGSKSVWHFAPARMNSIQFRLLHKSHEVWSVPQIAPPWTNVQDRSKPYTLFPRLEKLDEGSP